MGTPLPNMIVLPDDSFENLFPQTADNASTTFVMITRLPSIQIEIHNYEEKNRDNTGTH